MSYRSGTVLATFRRNLLPPSSGPKRAKKIVLACSEGRSLGPIAQEWPTSGLNQTAAVSCECTKRPFRDSDAIFIFPIHSSHLLKTLCAYITRISLSLVISNLKMEAANFSETSETYTIPIWRKSPHNTINMLQQENEVPHKST
jgi:hypothetical protein